MNNINLSIKNTPPESNIVQYTYSLNILLDMCILRKKYNNFIMLVQFEKNSECAFNFTPLEI